MANEARVTSSLYIRKTSGSTVLLEHRSQGPNQFQADVNGTKGPVPGAIAVPTTGVAVDFSELTEPGLCELKNLSATHYVEYGIREPVTGLFYPLGILRPGRHFVIEFSPNLAGEFTGTGTGTGPDTNQFFLKANGAECQVYIGCFEA